MIFGKEKDPAALHGSWVFDRYLKRSAQYGNLSISQFCRMVCPDCKLEKRTRVVHVHIDGGNYGCELHIPAGVPIDKYVESFLGFLGRKVEIHPDDVIDVILSERKPATPPTSVGNVRPLGGAEFVGACAVDFSRTRGVCGEMPKLIPISEVAEVPVRVGGDIPKLVPISDVPTRAGDMPKLVPISGETPKLVPIPSATMPKLEPIPVGDPVPNLIPIGDGVPDAVPIGTRRTEHSTLVNFANAIRSFTGAIGSKVGTPPGFDLRDRTKRRVVFAYSDAAFERKIGTQSLKEYLIAKSKVSPQEYAAALYALFVDTVAERPDEWKDGMSFSDYVERHGVQSKSSKGVRSVEFDATAGNNKFVLRANLDTREISVTTRVGTFSKTSFDEVVPAGTDYPTVVLFKMEKPFGAQ